MNKNIISDTAHKINQNLDAFIFLRLYYYNQLNIIITYYNYNHAKNISGQQKISPPPPKQCCEQD